MKEWVADRYSVGVHLEGESAHAVIYQGYSEGDKSYATPEEAEFHVGEAVLDIIKEESEKHEHRMGAFMRLLDKY